MNETSFASGIHFNSDNPSHLPESIVFVLVYDLSSRETLSIFENFRDSPISPQETHLQSKSILLRVLSDQLAPSRIRYYRSFNYQFEWACVSLGNGIGILTLFYSVLGGNKIRELMEEYTRIFDNSLSIESNLAEFKRSNFEQRKSKNFYISRLVGVSPSEETDSRMSSTKEKVNQINKIIVDDQKSLFKQQQPEVVPHSKLGGFVLKIVLLTMLVFLGLVGFEFFIKRSGLHTKVQNERSLLQYHYGEKFHQFINK